MIEVSLVSGLLGLVVGAVAMHGLREIEIKALENKVKWYAQLIDAWTAKETPKLKVHKGGK